MKKILTLGIVIIGLMTGCIKDDFILDAQDPEVRIVNSPDSIGINLNHTFEAMYLNDVGQEENVDFSWFSTNENVLSINTTTGNAAALELGNSMIIAEYDNGENVLRDSVEVSVGENTVTTINEFSGTVNTTSSYALTGDFTITQEGDDVVLTFANNYNASTALPGLYVYLSNNANSSANAYEIGAVQVFSGAHSYTIPNTSIYDYNYVLYFCKPFGIKVGHGEIIQ